MPEAPGDGSSPGSRQKLLLEGRPPPGAAPCAATCAAGPRAGTAGAARPAGGATAGQRWPARPGRGAGAPSACRMRVSRACSASCTHTAFWQLGMPRLIEITPICPICLPGTALCRCLHADTLVLSNVLALCCEGVQSKAGELARRATSPSASSRMRLAWTCSLSRASRLTCQHAHSPQHHRLLAKPHDDQHCPARSHHGRDCKL